LEENEKWKYLFAGVRGDFWGSITGFARASRTAAVEAPKGRQSGFIEAVKLSDLFAFNHVQHSLAKPIQVDAVLAPASAALQALR
jgi:hypothetical protein